MTYVVSILAFILIIGLLIFIHEFGHFFLARRNGIGVTEFAVGMGPKLFSWVRNGTRYSIRTIPFGGYCSMLGGEGYFAEDGDMDDARIVSDEDHAFPSKSVWARISVTIAGPVFNFLLALFLAFVLVSLVGAQDTRIAGVGKDFPAAEAGLQKDDLIVKLDHTSVHLFKDITIYMTMHEGEEVKVTYERDGETYETVLKPKYMPEEDRYLIGIGAYPRREDLSIGEVLKFGWYEFAFNTGAVFKSLGMLFTGKASFNDLSGPVGMADMVTDIVDDVNQSTEGEGFWTKAYWIFVNLLSFMVLISANLGVMNLLPIPGLDGGRLIFLLIEAVRGKPIDKKKEGIVTVVGMLLLILLMVAVFFNDIRKIIFG